MGVGKLSVGGVGWEVSGISVLYAQWLVCIVK